MITAEMIMLVKSQVSFVPKTKQNLPPLINDSQLTGNKFGIYGNAGDLSGKVNSSLYGSANNKRGCVREDLFGYWGDLSGDISEVYGCATGTSGDATGTKGSLNTVYGDITGCRDDMTGVIGDVSLFSGSFRGIQATTVEIMDILLGAYK